MLWLFSAKIVFWQEVRGRFLFIYIDSPISVGWASTPSHAANNAVYNQPYDQNVYGGMQGQAGIKAGMINLLSAVRTVMRSGFGLF